MVRCSPCRVPLPSVPAGRGVGSAYAAPPAYAPGGGSLTGPGAATRLPSGGPEAQAIADAAWTRQDDPELERLRREVWRKNRHIVYWVFGFPVLAIGVGALVLAFFPR